MISAPFQRYYEKMLSRYKKCDYPNRSPCWCRQPTTPLGRRAGGRKEPELRSQAMGSQVLRPAVFPDVLLNKTSVKDALKGVEHLERW